MSKERSDLIASAAERRIAKENRRKHISAFRKDSARIFGQLLHFSDDIPSKFDVNSIISSNCFSEERVSASYLKELLPNLADLSQNVLLTFNEYYYIGVIDIPSSKLDRIIDWIISANDSAFLKFGNDVGGVLLDYYDDPFLPNDKKMAIFARGEPLCSRLRELR